MTAHLLPTTHVLGSVTILPAKPGDFQAIVDLVRTVNLPPDGIEDVLEYFWVAREGERIIGTAGLEVYADQALLRSVAVSPERQRLGLGRALTDTALSYLATRQFQAVYLLTTTAEAFFAYHGFCRMPRIDIPPGVQRSIELQSVCPTTATCMARRFTYPAAATTSELLLRAARFADLPAMQEIRNQGILDRVATLDAEPYTTQDTLVWFGKHGPRHPVLVAEAAAGIVGWASLNTFNPRKAYQYVADLSVYIERQQRGKGIGTRLLQAITSLGQALGYHKIVLSAFPSNTAGMRLYERQGFTTVGIYKEMGRLDGRWVDTILMEKLLGTAS